jgi:acyl-CoA hydrolase
LSFLIFISSILAAVNPTMPRTFGDSTIHMSQIDAIVNVETPIFAIPENGPPPSPEEEKIGKLIAENLVEDGATLQMGNRRLVLLRISDPT